MPDAALGHNVVNSVTLATFKKRLKTHRFHFFTFSHRAPLHFLWRYTKVYHCIVLYCKPGRCYAQLAVSVPYGGEVSLLCGGMFSCGALLVCGWIPLSFIIIKYLLPFTRMNSLMRNKLIVFVLLAACYPSAKRLLRLMSIWWAERSTSAVATKCRDSANTCRRRS